MLGRLQSCRSMSTSESKPETPSPDGEVGARIRKAREGLQLTQAHLATRTRMADPDDKGISRTALVGYEAGSSRPGLREIRLLCEVLKISPNWLIFGSESPVQTSLPSLDLVRGSSLQSAVRTGFAIAALKGHEREALMSLALSLAGRQLGDLRLSALLSFAGPLAVNLDEALARYFDRHGGSVPGTLEELMDSVSEGAGATWGTKLTLDPDADSVSGDWLYPDPKSKNTTNS